MGSGARGRASFCCPANAADFTEIRGMFHIRCRKRRRDRLEPHVGVSSLPFASRTFSSFRCSSLDDKKSAGQQELSGSGINLENLRPSSGSSLNPAGCRPDMGRLSPCPGNSEAAPARHEKRGTCVPLSDIFTPAWQCSYARRGPWWRPRRSCGYTDPWRRRASPSQWRRSGHCSSPPASRDRRRPFRWGSG